jgi:hypothetical protein
MIAPDFDLHFLETATTLVDTSLDELDAAAAESPDPVRSGLSKESST